MVVTLGMAAAASVVGAYNWAANLYSYNRDAWMTDIQVEQEHTYQTDNLKIAMHEMDREEVRDLMQNCINKINNTILVTTLILSLAGEMLFEGQIPSDCAPFVLNAYMLCLGSAIFHLVLSILFGLFASSEAYEKSTEFLTRRIKPAWKENFKRMKHRKRAELTQAFEEKPLSAMLKPPLAGRANKVLSRMWGERRRQSKHGSVAEGEPVSWMSEDHNKSFERMTSELESGVFGAAAEAEEAAMANRRGSGAMHHQTSQWRQEDWEEAEKDWIHFTGCMFKCVCFGTKNLLEACSYLCIATLYGKYENAWVFWATQIIFTSLNVLMMHFFIAREKERDFPNMPPCMKGCLSHPWFPPHLVALVPATGPMMVAAAATVPIEAFDRFFIPIGYLSHVVVLCFFFSYLCHMNRTNTEEEEEEEEGIEAEVDEEDEEEEEGEEEQDAEEGRGCQPPLCCLSADLPAERELEEIPPGSVGEPKAPSPPASARAEYSPMSTADEARCSLLSDRGAPSRPAGRRRTPSCRPLELELPQESPKEQVTHRSSVSARSTRASLGYSDRSQKPERSPPKTPRTRARGVFVRNSMVVFPSSVRALPDFMLCRGLFILMLLWVSALVWALHNAYTQDFRDRDKWPDWIRSIFAMKVETLEVENFPFLRPSPYFQPHAVTCPIEGKFFMADSFRVFDLKEGLGGDGPHKPRPFPCDVNGTIADIAAVCNDKSECWPVVLLETQPPKVYDCRTNETWTLLQGATHANRLATRGNSAQEQGLDVLYASEGGQVVQYSRSPRRHGFAPEWVVQEHEPEILALDVVDNFLVAFKSNRLVEYQDLDSGLVCGRWQIPAGQKVIGGGCARGNTIHILATEGHSIHILKSRLPDSNRCNNDSRAHGAVSQRVLG